MKLFMFLALLGMAVLGLASPPLVNNLTNNLTAATTLPSLSNSAITTGLVKKDDIGSSTPTINASACSAKRTSTTPSPWSTVTEIHKNMTSALWTIYIPGMTQVALVSTQSSNEVTHVFETSTFNDSTPTTTGLISYAPVPTSLTTVGMGFIFTLTIVHERTFTVHATGARTNWAVTSTETMTQTEWPFEPKSVTVLTATTATVTA